MSDENNKPLDWDELSIMRALVSFNITIQSKYSDKSGGNK